MGVAYALIYPPDNYAEAAEIVAVCKVVARYGGLYISHVRSEAARLHQGISEAIEIGRRANCPVEIYHLKASGQENWWKIPEIIAMIDQARTEGIDGEGLQIGDGTVDFGMVAEVLDRTAPKASFIPEIWQGHKNDGAGFWTALDRLEKWF